MNCIDEETLSSLTTLENTDPFDSVHRTTITMPLPQASWGRLYEG